MIIGATVVRIYYGIIYPLNYLLDVLHHSMKTLKTVNDYTGVPNKVVSDLLHTYCILNPLK